MAYKPRQARYDQGGKVTYLVYESPQPLANGRVAMRTRVRRLYFPGDARNISLGKPGQYRNLRGRNVFGVPVTYSYVLAPATVHRGKTIAHLPPRKAHRTKDRPAAKRRAGSPPDGPSTEGAAAGGGVTARFA